MGHIKLWERADGKQIRRNDKILNAKLEVNFFLVDLKVELTHGLKRRQEER